MADEKKLEEAPEDELDQIIRDMADEPEALEAPAPVAAPAVSIAKAKPSAAPKRKVDQSLTMELSGVINLKLCFASGDRSIEVLCTEESLLCRMADGTEFRIPTGIPKSRNAA